jgi:hypothetical protein
LLGAEPLAETTDDEGGRMASSIGATNSRDMTEPFTPAGAASNWSREREPREPEK